MFNVLAIGLGGCGQNSGEAPSLDGGAGAGGGGGTTTPAACGSGGVCRMFVTMDTNFSNGALGATAALDSACNSDSNKPTTGTYKALIMRTSRQPGNGWILYANQTYTRKNGTTVIATTNSSSIFAGALTNPVVSLGTDIFWITGITINGSAWGYAANNTCTNYASNSGSVNLAIGYGASTLDENFGSNPVSSNANTVLCDGSDFSTVASQVGLLCVEQ